MLFISLRRPLTQRWTSSHRLVQFMLKHPHLWAELCRPKYWKYSTASHRKHWLLVFGVFQVVGTLVFFSMFGFPERPSRDCSHWVFPWLLHQTPQVPRFSGPPLPFPTVCAPWNNFTGQGPYSVSFTRVHLEFGKRARTKSQRKTQQFT